MFIQRVGASLAFPTRSPTQQTVPAAYLQTVSLSFSVIILICSAHSYLTRLFVWISAPAQEVDDVARVSEAVTKAVVCAFKSAPSDDNTDNWLNPTEVANECCGINYSIKSIALWLIPPAFIDVATEYQNPKAQLIVFL